MPPRPKYQVFISSTYGDLREEREAVTWAILSARHIPAGMENFTATDDRGWQTILSVINRSDYYVLILAGRYGSLDTDGLSWTEKEYEYALSRKIPVLAFVRSKHSTTADKMEDDPAQREKLENFKRKVRERHLCKEWTTIEELVGQVRNAITNHIIDDEENGCARPGWYRGDEMPAASTLDEFARLSEENARLHEELAEVKSSAENASRLMLVDHDEQPFPSELKSQRSPIVSYPEVISLEKMEEVSDTFDYLVVNTLVSLELGVQNISGSLVEHITVDLSLKPILGFRCGWNGIDLIQYGGLLTSSMHELQFSDRYPDSVSLLAPGHVRIRLRVPRIPAGGTEYLPHLFVIGAVNAERSWFNLDYKLVGSVGAPLIGGFRHEIVFGDLTHAKPVTLNEERVKIRDKARINDLNQMLFREQR
jgi:hypothetical protein